MHRASKQNIRPGRALFLASCKLQNPKSTIQKIEVVSHPDSDKKLFSFTAEIGGDTVTIFSDHVGLSSSKRHRSGLFFTKLQAKKHTKRHLMKTVIAAAQNKRAVRKSVVEVIKAHSTNKDTTP